MIKSIVFIVLLFYILGAQAQVESFSSNSEKFLEQLSKHLGSFDKKDAKDFVEEFTPIWTAMKASEQSKVVDNCNKIVSQKLRVYPEFKSYISSVNQIFKRKYESSVFNDWNDAVSQVLGQKQKKRMASILVNSAAFFELGNFYDSKKLAWHLRSGDFKYGYDKSPFISFENATIVCYANNDSTVIENTSGEYRPYTFEFLGKAGKIFWTRVGFDKNETYGEFKSKYKINIKTSNFSLDSVSFYNSFFEKPLIGKVEEKVLKVAGDREKTYPRFFSYSQRLSIKDIMPEVDYDGGFTMHGATFIGSGTPEQPAKLTFYRKGQPFITTASQTYNIKSDKISAPSAAATIILDKDSIYHPGLNLEYVLIEESKTNKISLIRNNVGVGMSPFSNSYHNLEMYVESMTWTKGDSTVIMGPLFGSSNSSAVFESANYFDRIKFDRIGNMSQMHPMVAIARHSVRFDQFEFSTADLATALGRTTTQVTGLLYDLNNNGFIVYNKDKEMVYIKQKLFDYIDNRSGTKDYDNIVLFSDLAGKANAYLNATSFELNIKGVKKFSLSDAQMVTGFPKPIGNYVDQQSGNKVAYGEVKVYKDRNIKFDGTLLAGSTDYFGTDFNFVYEDFLIKIPQCDSMKLWVWPFEGGNKQTSLVTVIEDVKGEIDINDPSNKASLDTSFNNYPLLKCTKETYVFYDKSSRGAYPRETFKFKIKPFTLDSLDNFNRDGLSFAGSLESAGIFPEFEENLVVLTDYSLGFVRQAPKDGYNLYKDKGLFQNTIALSSKGLQGDGIIEFATSVSVSKAFTFFPDSTVGVVDSFVNEAKEKPLEYPDVKGYGVKVSFNPDKGILTAASKDKNLLSFFNNEATLKGKLSLTEQMMTGRGKMKFGNADLSARKFNYFHHRVQSDTAEFDLATLEQAGDDNPLAFKTDNVSANVDFKDRQGIFKSNGENTYVTFPDNQYICYMDEFKWFMDDDDIELQKKSDLEIESTEFEKPNFYSIHPDQDSLSYMAPKARFDLRKKTITCTEVPFMDVADARIVPDSGLVIVKKKAKIQTLENAIIIADNVSKNHKIINVTVDVTAKRKYKASGDYFYVDEDQNEFKIHFANIQPDSTFTTYAEGEIKEEENFKLSKNYEFIGKVELYAVNKSLIFDGATRISHACDQLAKNRMNFRAQIDPLDIYIPVGEDLQDENKDPIGAGLVMNPSPDSLGIYSTFLSRKGSVNHPNVITASGFLYFDKASKEYRISNKEKLLERSLPGNYISLQTDNCIVEGDGTITFGAELGQLSAISVGVVKHNMQTDLVELAGGMVIDFPFNDDALEKMADKINKSPDLLPIELGKTFYKKTLTELIDKDKAEEIFSEITLKQEIKGKFPKELLKSMYIADVKFKWDAEMNAFVSQGLIGIANIKKEQVYKYVNGKIVIEKKTPDSKGNSKDKIYIYLDVDPTAWYYFEYSMGKEGKMQVVSKDNDFNSVIAETKEDKMKYKGDKGVADFSFLLGAPSKRSGFLRRFEE